ncbi:MAG TPA: hypothetical protein VE641_12190 [Chthoniobacterales bacterium]|nr:hypothetical protein [Chthoniobacterales bacterium]
MKNLPLTLVTKRLAPTSLTGEAGHREKQSYVGRAFRMLAVVGVSVVVPTLWAQQTQTAASPPGAAWSAIQQLVQNLESAVQSKNLHGIHEPSMKIRAPIRALKQHSSMLSAATSQKMVAALKQLDNAITDLHSAADAGNQKEADSAVKEVQTAFDQLKSLDPDTAFKDMH